jgi:serine O-acetyltransferase
MDLNQKFKFFKKLIVKSLVFMIKKIIILKFEGDLWKIKVMLNKLQRSSIKKKCYMLAYEEILRRNGSWIGQWAQFEDKPEFPHGIMGIFISHGAKIGKNCIIFHHVTIGSNRLLDSKSKGVPTIGNDCYIGAGAKIIGNVKIGNNCRIGANCVVSKDMPDSSVAVLTPTKTIQKKDLDNHSQIPLESFYATDW